MIQRRVRTAKIRRSRPQMAYTRSIMITDLEVAMHLQVWNEGNHVLSLTEKVAQNGYIREVAAVSVYARAMRASVPPPSKRMKCSHAQLRRLKISERPMLLARNLLLSSQRFIFSSFYQFMKNTHRKKDQVSRLFRGTWELRVNRVTHIF